MRRGKKKHTCAHVQVYVNMRFLPPFGLCSFGCLGCGRNIYGTVVRVIYPHKASAALWRRCKYGAWLAAPTPPSFLSSLQRWVKVAPIQRNEIGFFNGQTKPWQPFHRRYTKTLKMIPLVGLLYQLMVLSSPQQWNIEFLYWPLSLVCHFFFLENATDVSILILSETLSFRLSKWYKLWIHITHTYNINILCFKDLFFIILFLFELLKMYIFLSRFMVLHVCWWGFSHFVVVLCACLDDRK